MIVRYVNGVEVVITTREELERRLKAARLGGGITAALGGVIGLCIGKLIQFITA